MRTKALIILVASLVMSSCANMGHFKYIMKPEVINKKELLDDNPTVTKKHQLKIVTVENLKDYEPEISDQVDLLFTEYSECMNVSDKGDRARLFLIAVVNSTFTCNYHHGMCNGEYDPQNDLIIVSYKAFKRKGMMPLLQHEWAHAYGALNADHSNIGSVIHCIKY